MKLIFQFFKSQFQKISYRIDPIKASRRLGVKIGNNCRLVGRIDWGSEPYLVRMGNHVSITSSSFITHDGGVWLLREEFPKLDIFAPIVIGSNVFIGHGCIILPGAVIENNVLVGAGSLVRGKLRENKVYAGVPCKEIKTIDSYREQSLQNSHETKQLSYSEKRDYLLNLFKF